MQSSTPSCTASATSRSCAARRTRRNWSSARSRSNTRGLAITDECSFAGSVRAHLELKELRENDEPARSFRLIHGTEIQLAEGEGRATTPGARLVLLAQTRAGYGNLSQLVTLARRQADQGQLPAVARPTSRRTRSGCRTCSRCWCRCAPGASRSTQRACEREARWLAASGPAPSWIACELTRGADDARTLATLQAIGDAAGPAAGRGRRRPHARCAGRRKLADVLTAVRHEDAARAVRPRARAERRALPAAAVPAGAHLPDRTADADAGRSPSAARSRSTNCVTSTRRRSFRPARRRRRGCGARRTRKRRRATPTACRRKCAPSSSTNSR